VSVHVFQVTESPLGSEGLANLRLDVHLDLGLVNSRQALVLVVAHLLAHSEVLLPHALVLSPLFERPLGCRGHPTECALPLEWVRET